MLLATCDLARRAHTPIAPLDGLPFLAAAGVIRAIMDAMRAITKRDWDTLLALLGQVEQSMSHVATNCLWIMFERSEDEGFLCEPGRTSPHISPHLTTSHHISPHLPTLALFHTSSLPHPLSSTLLLFHTSSLPRPPLSLSSAVPSLQTSSSIASARTSPRGLPSLRGSMNRQSAYRSCRRSCRHLLSHAPPFRDLP